MKYTLFCLWLLICNCSDISTADQTCLWVRVDKVVDGDTLRLKDGRWVRCAAIDTPEIDHRNKQADPLGYEARNFLKKQVSGKRICLKSNQQTKDNYGRLIAYLYDEHGTMINAAIVAHGLAYVYPHADQNRSHSRLLLDAQRQAMRKRLGIWRHRLEVKGAFIGNRRSKRFHLTDCTSATRINPKNRKGFATIWDAYWSGYAPAAGCLGSKIKKELQRR